jgi:hypothetical protein
MSLLLDSATAQAQAVAGAIVLDAARNPSRVAHEFRAKR